MSRTQSEILASHRKRLADELAKYDRSQSALARHLGIDQSAVSRMISGGRRIRLEEQGLIEDYLRKTDPAPHFRPLDELPREAAEAYDPLAAFPALEKLVSSAPEDMRKLVALDNDYPLVMTCVATLEQELSRVVAGLISEGELDYEIFGYGVRSNLVEKVEAVQQAGRLAPRQAAQLLAAFAVRDAFAHSRTPLHLKHPDVFAVVDQVLSPGYFEAPSLDQKPEVLRLSFLLSTIALAHLLATNDPTRTAEIFLAAAAKVLEQSDAERNE